MAGGEDARKRRRGCAMAQQFPTSQAALGDYVEWQQQQQAPMHAFPGTSRPPAHMSLAALVTAHGAHARPAAPGLTMQDLLQLAMSSGGAGSPGAVHAQAFAGLPRQPGCELPFPISATFAAAARNPVAVSTLQGVHDGPTFLAHLAPAVQGITQGASSAPAVSAKREDPSESDGEQSDGERESRGSVNTIFPRRKQGQHARMNSQPVVLNEATLSQLFTLPLHKAAVKLGISATAMKSACRKLGIKKWPYRALSGTSTKQQRKTRTCSPSGASSRRSGKSALASSCSESHSDHSSDLSKDAQLLAETMRLLQKGVQSERQAREEQSASSSDSECGSEISGASTREGQQEISRQESFSPGQGPLGQSSPGSSAPPAAPNSVASLLN